MTQGETEQKGELMEIEDIIREIIQQIRPGMAFDSHFVIRQLISRDLDAYVRFVANSADFNRPGLHAHQRIGHVINSLAQPSDGLCQRFWHRDERQQSWSINIKGKPGECALWLRL